MSAWMTDPIDINEFSSGKILYSVFNPLNDTMKTLSTSSEFQSIGIWTLLDEQAENRYCLGRYREKLLAWVCLHSTVSAPRVVTEIPKTKRFPATSPEHYRCLSHRYTIDGSTTFAANRPQHLPPSLYIGTISDTFYWVFQDGKDLSVDQEYDFDNENYITLTLAHLINIDFCTFPETYQGMLTQAMEQTKNFEDIAHFFLNKHIQEQLKHISSELSSKLGYQLRDKLLRTNKEDTDNFVLALCQKWKNSNKTSVSVEDLTCLVKTTLLPPILTKFKHLQIDTSKITANLTSLDVSDFSTNDFINLFTSAECICLFKQAFSRVQKPTLLKLLLTNHCNNYITFKNKLGDGLAGIFAGSGMVEGLNYVIEHSQSLAYQRNNMGETPFYLAAQNGHKNCVEVLLTLEEDARRQNIDFNEATNYERTPLEIAAINGHELVIKAMKEMKDINFNRVNNRFPLSSPLKLAVMHGHTAIVKNYATTRKYFH